MFPSWWPLRKRPGRKAYSQSGFDSLVYFNGIKVKQKHLTKQPTCIQSTVIGLLILVGSQGTKIPVAFVNSFLQAAMALFVFTPSVLGYSVNPGSSCPTSSHRGHILLLRKAQQEDEVLCSHKATKTPRHRPSKMKARHTWTAELPAEQEAGWRKTITTISQTHSPSRLPTDL